MRISRIGIVGVGGMLAASAVFGFAAGLTNTVAKLGGSNAVVASCDTDGVTTSWTSTYDATLGAYKVATVNVDLIDAGCLGATLKVQLATAANAPVGDEMTFVMTTGLTSHEFTVAGTAIPAASVESASAVLVGGNAP